MSMLNMATGDGGNAGGAGAAGDGGGVGVVGDVKNGGGDGGGAGAAGDGGTLDVSKFGDEFKNPEVYKDGKLFGEFADLASVGKALSEARTKAGAAPKAPDQWDFSAVKLEKFPEAKVDMEDTTAKVMMPLMQKAGLSQEQANILAAGWLEMELSGAIDPQKELAALGREGQAMINNVADIAKTAPKDLQADIEALTTTAAGIRVLHWALQGKVEGKISAEIANRPVQSAVELKAAAFKYKEDNAKTIESDPAQQRQYRDMLSAAMAAEETEKRTQKK